MKKLSILLLGCMLAQATSHAQSKQAVNLELNKEYSVQGFKFTVQSVNVHKDSYPMGMFGGRPSNPNMNPSFDGVLGIVLTLTQGDGDAFMKLERFLVNEKGEKNVKEDMMVMSNAPKFTVLINVPLSARKLKFSVGSLELNLEKVIRQIEK